MKQFSFYCVLILLSGFLVMAHDYKQTKIRQQDLIKVIESNKAVMDEYQERVIELEITVYGP